MFPRRARQIAQASRHGEIHPAKIGCDRSARSPQRITQVENGFSELAATTFPKLLLCEAADSHAMYVVFNSPQAQTSDAVAVCSSPISVWVIDGETRPDRMRKERRNRQSNL